jgi:phage baseplate assembly protein W
MTVFKGFSTYNRTKRYTLTDFDLVKQDIFNHFNIRKGEKLMRPEFGTSLWDLLFEPFGNEISSAIEEEVRQIVSVDPRVRLEKVIVDTYDNGINIAISLVFVPLNLGDVLYLKFDLENKAVSLAQ